MSEASLVLRVLKSSSSSFVTPFFIFTFLNNIIILYLTEVQLTRKSEIFILSFFSLLYLWGADLPSQKWLVTIISKSRGIFVCEELFSFRFDIFPAILYIMRIEKLFWKEGNNSTSFFCWTFRVIARLLVFILKKWNEKETWSQVWTKNKCPLLLNKYEWKLLFVIFYSIYTHCLFGKEGRRRGEDRRGRGEGRERGEEER